MLLLEQLGFPLRPDGVAWAFSITCQPRRTMQVGLGKAAHQSDSQAASRAHRTSGTGLGQELELKDRLLLLKAHSLLEKASDKRIVVMG